jgi:protein TonB
MKKITLIILMIVSFSNIFGQDNMSENIYRNVQQKPEFPGGEDALGHYIQRNLRYPSYAAENQIEGSVQVEIIINEDGTTQISKVIKGIKGGCDEEALRLLTKMPRWMPGKQNGNAVKTYYTISIPFKIDY